MILSGKEHYPCQAIPFLMIGSSREKMPGSRVICASGFPLVSRVQHTLAFTLLGRGHVDFCMISVLRRQNVS